MSEAQPHIPKRSTSPPSSSFMAMDRYRNIVYLQTGNWPTSRRPPRRKTPASDSFLDDGILDSPPSYSATDFEKPRLRRCRFSLANIDWNRSKHLGGGLDGHSWQVFFGSNGPYVLKMFWDLEQPKHYFAPERECQNAAVLTMIEASVSQAAAALAKIYINPNPKTKEEAVANFEAFAKEGLKSQSRDTEGLLGISALPRLRKCYGWLKINKCGIPARLQPPTVWIGKDKRFMSGNGDHIAIIYEYIEEGENVTETVEEVGNFLWQAGFTFTNYGLERNWKSGVLVDMSEIVHVHGYGWRERDFVPQDAKRLLGIPFGVDAAS